MLSKQVPLGIYEKALPAGGVLAEAVTAGEAAGFRFCRNVGG